MVRNILFSTIALTILSTTAFAADLPSRRAPPLYVPPPIPVFSWTGFYVGGQVGYGFGTEHLSNGVLPVTTHPHGVLGGAHVGYNFAGFPGVGTGLGGLVFGVEGDVDGSDYRDAAGVGAVTQTVNIQGSARGRLGIAVDRALFYATGGAAFAEFQTSYGAPLVASFSRARVGWTVGGGVEYAITTNWSLRAEYRYSDFGSFVDVPVVIPISHRNTLERAQVGFSYKFDTLSPLPVVARY